MTNYIFDLAGVIINLDIERDTKALNNIGLPDFEGCLKQPEIAVPTLAYLNGLMPEQEYCDTIRPVCRQNVTDEEILWAMDDVLDIIPSSRIDMLMELRKEHKVYLLSNIYDRGWQIATEAFRKHGVAPEDCFDHLFLSHEMQLAKPDPRIFHAVIDTTGIKPEETLFLDDSRSNIETAKNIGFQAQLVPMNKLESITQKIYLQEQDRKNHNLWNSDCQIKIT